VSAWGPFGGSARYSIGSGSGSSASARMLSSGMGGRGGAAAMAQRFLLQCVGSGNTSLVKRTLDDGADPNEPTADGTTALMTAAGFTRVRQLSSL
jgi:Ankyrin repeats (many copies)